MKLKNVKDVIGAAALIFAVVSLTEPNLGFYLKGGAEAAGANFFTGLVYILGTIFLVKKVKEYKEYRAQIAAKKQSDK